MKQRILTWLQCTSDQIHIWNYFGAVVPMLEYQKQDLDIFMMVADLHSITKFNQDVIKNTVERSKNLLKIYIAAWVDPSKTTVFQQSKIHDHLQLSRILWCATHMWFMERMHSYKDAVAKWKQNEVSIWTFTYPVLMAADILLYDTNIVPVWRDQKQHVEYARDIAWKMNRQFGEWMFVLPQPKIDEELGEIPGLDGRKMSKSYNNFIGLLDDQDTIYKKVKTLVTDAVWIDDPKNPETDNLYLNMKPFLTEEEHVMITNRYLWWWMSFKDAKEFLYNKIIWLTTPLQLAYSDISDEYINQIILDHTEKARVVAQETMERVNRLIRG